MVGLLSHRRGERLGRTHDPEPHPHDETGQRGQARRKVIDQVAATLILSGYLEATTERTWETQEDQNRIADMQVDSQRDPRGRRPR